MKEGMLIVAELLKWFVSCMVVVFMVGLWLTVRDLIETHRAMTYRMSPRRGDRSYRMTRRKK